MARGPASPIIWPNLRRCTHCGKWKPTTEYTTTGKRKGFTATCKLCKADENWLRLMDARTPDEIIKTIEAEDLVQAKRRQYLKDKYNIEV